ILGAQDQLDLQGIEQLNYFPNLNDSLSNVASQLRYSWYGFNSLPRTVLNGDHQINGYNSNYQNQYAFLADQVLAERTFVSSSNCEFSYFLISDQLNGEITLRNEQTILYNLPTEYNLVTSSKLFAGLFRKVDLAGRQRFVLQRWLLHAEPLGGTLLAGQDLSHSFNVPMNNLSLAELAQDYRVYYWLQLADGHRIIYSDWADFDNIVSVDEELQGAPRLLISSNPLRTGSEMKISMRGGHALDGIKVYNLRGQCVMNLADRQKEYTLNASNFPASGVYLLRTGYTDRQGRKQNSVNKIIVIK
ncbi:MAG: T9SS type A sorting domain-containing protein, partial [Candidatus Cloacimonetes bacterium]|nr:T9SS type A sorting domain-containing protein [Candidatus Cloacimonadota bacterium]